MNRMIAAAAFAALALASPAGALTLVEVGDFSDDPSAPDPFTLEIGENFLIGNLGVEDRDFLEFVLPPGEMVTTQWLLDVDFPNAPGGSVLALSCEYSGVTNCFGPVVRPNDPLPLELTILDEGLQISSSVAFADCTGPGCDYTVRVFVGAGDDFDPTPPSGEVPLPASAALLALGIAGLL
ncbi:MAG: hypothetical protein AAF676_05320, partial [Pseudomonadota bacterium]